MTVENVLRCAALALIELMIVVQIRMMLPRKRDVLIYLTELKQQLLQDINVLSHITKIQKLTLVTLKGTTTMTARDIIKMQCLDTMLLATMSVKTMFLIFCTFPIKSLTELSNLLNQLLLSQIPINKNQKIKF